MKFKYLLLFFFLLLLSFGCSYLIKYSMAAELSFSPATPSVISRLVPISNEEVGVIVTWNVPAESDYGYKIDKKGINGRETAVILDPDEEGDSNLSNDGFYFDSAVVIGDTYTYYVTSFDRDGEESPAASTTIKIELLNLEDEELYETCNIKLEELSGEANKGEVFLTWTKLCGDITYKIYRDDKLVGETLESSYLDKSVPNGNHNYRVDAYREKQVNYNFLIDMASAEQTIVDTQSTTVTVEDSPETSGDSGETDEIGTGVSGNQTKLKTGIKIPGYSDTFTNFADYISKFYSFSLKLGVGLCTLMIIYAGFKYMTSQGNPTIINEAKDITIGSLSGFLLLILTYFVLDTLGLPK